MGIASSTNFNHDNHPPLWDPAFAMQIRAGEVYGGVDAGSLNEENEDSDCTSSIKDLERQPKKPSMYN